MKRSNKEYILLALCVAGVLGFSPFAVLRFINEQWLLGIIDSILALVVILVGVYVWISRKVRLPSITLTFFYMVGMIAVVYIGGGPLVYWAFPAMTATYFLLKPNEAAVVNLFALLSIIPAIGMTLEYIEMLSLVVALILNNIFSFIFARSMQMHQDDLAFQATRDSLTGAANRRLFNEKIVECVAQMRRNNESASLIMLDIDHFKKVNDNYGHLVGDEVLIKLVEILRSRLRETDGLYRLGGEEFAILSIGVDPDTAYGLAEELRQLVENSKLLPDDIITISLGVTECSVTEGAAIWLERADRALYQAKNDGRNRARLQKIGVTPCFMVPHPV